MLRHMQFIPDLKGLCGALTTACCLSVHTLLATPHNQLALLCSNMLGKTCLTIAKLHVACNDTGVRAKVFNNIQQMLGNKQTHKLMWHAAASGDDL